MTFEEFKQEVYKKISPYHFYNKIIIDVNLLEFLYEDDWSIEDSVCAVLNNGYGSK